MAHVPPITVSVESAIHNALRDVLQSIYDQHGIRVFHVTVSWVDVSTHGGGPRHDVQSVTIETKKQFPLSV